MADIEAQNDSNKPRQLPGHLLKQARERLGLAQKDIASQLNLQLETIDALENDDRDRLPVAAYVRGYLRSYARLVKLNADMLVGLYEQDSAATPEIIPNIVKPTQVSSRDKPVRAITYLVTFILALLLLAWLQNKYIAEKNSTAVKDNTTAEEHLPLPGPPPRPETTTTAEKQNVQSVAPEGPLSLPPGGAEVTESILTETETQDMPAVETDLHGASPIGPEQITEQLTTAEDKLQFTVTRDSWIEVYDANKIKMYQGLARAGDDVKLAGRAPFSVLLGFAPGVAVRFNNDIFDTTPYTNAGIARFTLSAADTR